MASPDDASFVTVACKLPHGLIINLGDTTITLRGSNSQEAIGGYGFTLVRESFWNDWSAKFHDFQPVRLGLVYAMPKGRNARAEAQQRAGLKNGLEPLSPEAPIPGIKPVAKPNAIEPEPLDIAEAA